MKKIKSTKNKFVWALLGSIAFVACSYDYGLPKDDKDDQANASEDITVPANMKFVHPGLLHSKEDFDRMKTNVANNVDPWLSGYNKMIGNSHASSTYVMKGPVATLIRGGGSKEEPASDNYSTAMNDAHAAYLTAIRWKITGDVAYANKSIQILNAWAATCTRISGDSNKALGAGIYGYQFANAAEIMRDYSGWNAADLTKFKKWMLDVFYPVNYDFLQTHYNTCSSHYWANWDLCNLASIMSIAVLNDDVEKYTYVINYLMRGAGNGQLIKAINYVHPKSANDDIDLGQIQEAGRDQGHALMVVGLLGTIAQMAETQGLDVYGYKDNLILKGAEYEAKFNYARLAVPFNKYTNCDNITHTAAADDAARGQIRPAWERIYNYYTVKKGIKARYIKMAKDLAYPEGGSGEYDPNSGGYDDLGFGTLLYSR
ncbi:MULTISPECIES: alginate lyase family protein [Flavobacterium]|uniref:alginate lyase family protein n=1 Tax=Flavobacterium TaxID=237 RepID=UPI001183F31A|nr:MULTISPECIES: alginate lyase family protein [Flavobacterium]MCR4030669.1 alginate lyase family protein [Flavobacterium panacis]